jgi:hypothetical protein
MAAIIHVFPAFVAVLLLGALMAMTHPLLGHFLEAIAFVFLAPWIEWLRAYIVEGFVEAMRLH